MVTEPVSLAEARRIALIAQGFGARLPAKPAASHVRTMARRLHALQIDSVNVLVRAHYLPVYSRLGAYPLAVLDRLTNRTHELIELRRAHQASFVPVDMEPLFRWRNDDPHLEWRRRWRAAVDPAYVEAVEQEVTERGPIALSDLEDARRHPKRKPEELSIRRRDGKPYAESSLRWGRASDGKTVLDGLLHEGRLALAGRRGVERLYDLADRVLPEAVRAAPTPPPDDARRELVRRAAEALGVATIADLANYFELSSADTRRAVRELVDEGALEEARVETWKAPAFRTTGGRVPKQIDAAALLGPFDSLTWRRDRTKRLFGFDFSFEIYVPEPKRRYGYYVLPFLLGDRLVARVDLKADRARSTLMVAGAFSEPDLRTDHVAARLQGELDRMARWLSLERIETGTRGDLVGQLSAR